VAPTDLLLRPAEPADAEDLAAVHLAARRAAPMPPPVHGDDEVRRFLASRLDRDEVWVADLGGVVVGYLRLTPTWLDDLYVDPAYLRRGIGSAMLELAQALRPGGFGLWVFLANAPARAFYARHGLVEGEHTDGLANEEREPDVALRWEP